jgi:hypothetical protein
MNLAPAGAPISCEVTFDNGALDVAMSVFDTTSGSPVLISGPTAMALVVDYTYFGVFTPQAGHSYVVLKAVYTDNTFATLDPNHAQASESFYSQVSGGGGGGGASADPSITGYVDLYQTVIGYVNC